MITITIDDITIDCPDDLYEWLQQEAANKKQSVESLIVEILQTAQFFFGAH